MGYVVSIKGEGTFHLGVDGEDVVVCTEDAEDVAFRYSKEAAQALGTALLAAASGGGTEHRVSDSWNNINVDVSSVPDWLQLASLQTESCFCFNASEAKALLAAIASCIAAMDASNGGAQ